MLLVPPTLPLSSGAQVIVNPNSLQEQKDGSCPPRTALALRDTAVVIKLHRCRSPASEPHPAPPSLRLDVPLGANSREDSEFDFSPGSVAWENQLSSRDGGALQVESKHTAPHWARLERQQPSDAPAASRHSKKLFDMTPKVNSHHFQSKVNHFQSFKKG